MNAQQKQLVYDTWIPQVKEKIRKTGGEGLLERVPESRLKAIALMANTRMVWEKKKRQLITENAQGNATLQNTVGRSPFDFGNNPQNGYSEFYSQLGSGEVYVNLFGMFIEISAMTFAMDLVPMIPMSKSSIGIYIGEPVYAGGTLESAESKPEIIQVKGTANGGAALPGDPDVGSTFTIQTAASGGEDVATVTFVGRHRVNGNLVLRLGEVNDNSGGGGTNWKEALIADLFDSATSGAGIYTNGTDFVSFDAGSVDYLEGFTNYLAGYSGAGVDDQDPFFLNRGNGARYSQPMSRFTGSKTYYRSMGLRQFNRNYEAQTSKVDIELQTEQIQDMMMDHDQDANEFAESIINDQLSQGYNDHILGRMFALGWSNHHQMNQNNGFNINTFLGDSGTNGSAQTFLGKENTALTIAGAPGVLPSSGAISENLSSLQRRVVTRLLFGSGIVNTRSRRGRGDQSVQNVSLSTTIRDIRGYREAPFENDIDTDTGLSLLGSLYGIRTYEDNLMSTEDQRINVSRHGNEKDPGIKFCPYILNERISTIAEGTMAAKIAMISRYALPEVGSYPELNYMTFVVESEGGYGIV